MSNLAAGLSHHDLVGTGRASTRDPPAPSPTYTRRTAADEPTSIHPRLHTCLSRPLCRRVFPATARCRAGSHPRPPHGQAPSHPCVAHSDTRQAPRHGLPPSTRLPRLLQSQASRVGATTPTQHVHTPPLPVTMITALRSRTRRHGACARTHTATAAAMPP